MFSKWPKMRCHKRNELKFGIASMFPDFLTLATIGSLSFVSLHKICVAPLVLRTSELQIPLMTGAICNKEVNLSIPYLLLTI